MITQYDDIQASTIPASAQACAGYCDADFAGSWLAMVKRFPHLAEQQRVVSIATRTGSTARIIDIEPGNPGTPGEAAEWVVRMLAHGVYRPGVYTSASDMPAVHAAMARTGKPRSSYTLWVADWTGHAHLPAGYDACQWTDKGPNGCDVSVCLEAFYPTVKPPPPADPHHYEWFADFERPVVQRYDQLRRRPLLNRPRLRTARDQCAVYAGRILTVSEEHPDAKGDIDLQHFHRLWRLEQLDRRAAGQRLA